MLLRVHGSAIISYFKYMAPSCYNMFPSDSAFEKQLRLPVSAHEFTTVLVSWREDILPVFYNMTFKELGQVTKFI